MATFDSSPLPKRFLGFSFFKTGNFTAGTHRLILDRELQFPDIKVTKGSGSQIRLVPIRTLASSTSSTLSVSVKVISADELEIVIPATDTYTIAVK